MFYRPIGRMSFFTSRRSTKKGKGSEGGAPSPTRTASVRRRPPPPPPGSVGGAPSPTGTASESSRQLSKPQDEYAVVDYSKKTNRRSSVGGAPSPTGTASESSRQLSKPQDEYAVVDYSKKTNRLSTSVDTGRKTTSPPQKPPPYSKRTVTPVEMNNAMIESFFKAHENLEQGAYFVRSSNNVECTSNCVLVVKAKSGKILQIHIQQESDQFSLKGQTGGKTESLAAVLDHYKKKETENDKGEQFKLTTDITKTAKAYVTSNAGSQ